MLPPAEPTATVWTDSGAVWKQNSGSMGIATPLPLPVQPSEGWSYPLSDLPEVHRNFLRKNYRLAGASNLRRTDGETYLVYKWNRNKRKKPCSTNSETLT